MITTTETPSNVTPTTRKSKRKPPDPTNRIAEQLSVSAETVIERIPGNELIIEPIPLDMIERHRDNRRIDETSPSFLDLVQSIQAHGQRDAARVRRLPNGRYQLLSGERRWRACQAAGKLVLRCIVVEMTDAQALVEVALGNVAREDIDPIERAELLDRLTRSVDRGGAGMTKPDAGKLFGLDSESGVKNAMRLAKLPDAVKVHVKSRKIPERVARRLIPYLEIPSAVKAILDVVKRLKDEDDFAEFNMDFRDDETPYEIERAIRDNTRPMDAGVEDYVNYQVGNRQRLFPEPADLSELQIVSIPSTRNSKKGMERRALNTKLWDKLNQPYVEQALAKSKSKAGSKAKGSESSKPPKLTPAQQAAEDKRRKAAAEKRLETFTADWVCRLLRCTMSQEANVHLRIATLPVLLDRCGCFGGMGLGSYLAASLVELGLDTGKQRLATQSKFSLLSKPAASSDATVSSCLTVTLWAMLLWPVSTALAAKKHSVLSPAGELPDRIPYLSAVDVMELARQCNVTIALAWKDAATADTDQRRLVAAWLMRHTKDQLHKLRSELGVTEGSSTMGRDELAECILAWHKPGKPLPVPARLAKAVK